MFRSLFGGGGGQRARGFRPRQNGNGIHFVFPLVVGMASGELRYCVERGVVNSTLLQTPVLLLVQLVLGAGLFVSCI